MNYSLDFCRAWGEPLGSALFRSINADFIVIEDLGFEPSGEGEHIFLYIQKDGSNTQWLADQLAAIAGVKRNDVSFAGQKDRHAITTQWFSIYAPRVQELDWQQLEQRDDMQVKVLNCSRHNKKLRRGQHRANYFKLRLREFQVNETELDKRLQNIQEHGVPNYFGEQRFGIEANNLKRAQALLVEGEKIRAKQQKQMAISAARSYLFNQVLAKRVEQNTWTQALQGEALLEGRASAPLWGRGRSAAQDQALLVEAQALDPWAEWRDGLEHVGLNQERRHLSLKPEAMQWNYQAQEGVLDLQFSLPPGQFATALLREVAELKQIERPQSPAE